MRRRPTHDDLARAPRGLGWSERRHREQLGIYKLTDVLSEFRKKDPDIRVRVDFREAEGV